MPTARTASLTRFEGRELFRGKAPKKGRYPVAPKEARTVDGVVFGSLAEVRFYGALKVRQLLGEVSDIQLHPSFELVVNGVRIGKYTTDFGFLDEAGVRRYVEVKSAGTRRERDWKLRRALAEAIHGVVIGEVVS